MAGDMNLRHTLGRNAVDVSVGVEIMILRGNVDIIHVQKNSAVGALHDLVQEFPLGHFGNVKFGIAANVFHHYRDFQGIANLPNFLRRQTRSFKGVRHGQQVVRVAPVHASPAKMVRKPRSIRSLHQRFQAPEMLAIRTFCRPKIHGNAMLHHFVLLQNLIEDAQRSPAIDHEVLGDYFEPIHNRFARQNVIVMRCAQTNADSIVRKIVKSICGHSLLRSLKGDVEGRYNPSRPWTEESFRFLTQASWSRRLRSRPCLCKSSWLYSRCRSIYIHPCPCKNSDPCKRAFLSPSCRLAPDRPARQLSSQVEDSKLESLRWYRQANLRVPHQLLEPSWTLSFPELPPVEFGLQPLLLLLRHPDVFGCLFGLVL